MNTGAPSPFDPSQTLEPLDPSPFDPSHPSETLEPVDPTEARAPSTDDPGTVLVLGASGYVGGRLVPELVRGGLSVRCMTRSPDRLRQVPWAADVEIVSGDLGDPATLDDAFADVRQVVYLVHSLGDADFEAAELTAARHARLAAQRAGVERIVYLGGLGDESTDLSPHLRSRHAVGRELAAGPTRVIELRAAIVIGAGSASFEMMRSLVEVLPVMVTPRWVSSTRVQPIAIADVLAWLVTALRSTALEVERGESPDLSTLYAPGSVRQARRRLIAVWLLCLAWIPGVLGGGYVAAIGITPTLLGVVLALSTQFEAAWIGSPVRPWSLYAMAIAIAGVVVIAVTA